MDDATVAALAGIQQLYSRYCHAFDSKDPELFSSCFVDDGVMAVGEREFVGHESLRQLAEFGGDRPRHISVNPLVRTVSGDEATASAYFLTVDLTTGQNSGIGHYDDELVRDSEGDWRFVRRDIHFHWQSDAYRARAARIDETIRDADS